MFPTLENLCSFKLIIQSKGYIIDTCLKTIKSNFTDSELKMAMANFDGRLTPPTAAKFFSVF
jgi:hypothetical protein